MPAAQCVSEHKCLCSYLLSLTSQRLHINKADLACWYIAPTMSVLPPQAVFCTCMWMYARQPLAFKVRTNMQQGVPVPPRQITRPFAGISWINRAISWSSRLNKNATLAGLVFVVDVLFRIFVCWRKFRNNSYLMLSHTRNYWCIFPGSHTEIEVKKTKSITDNRS